MGDPLPRTEAPDAVAYWAVITVDTTDGPATVAVAGTLDQVSGELAAAYQRGVRCDVDMRPIFSAC